MGKLHIILPCLLLCLCLHPLSAQHKEEVGIATVEPGKSIYSTYGHTGLTIYKKDSNNPKRIRSWIYSYGTFNYKAPGFVRNFFKGHLNYYLGKAHLPVEMHRYSFIESRGASEQLLNLNQDEIERLYDYMEENAKEENKYFNYTFLSQNCSGKVLAALENVVGPIHYDQAVINTITSRSYRSFLEDYLGKKPWYELSIEILMGQNTDKLVALEDIGFLPDLVAWLLQDATLDDGRALVKKTRTLYKSEQTLPKASGIVTQPFILFTAMLVFLILIRLAGNGGKFLQALEWGLVFVAWILGLLFVYLWFISDHTIMDKNLNMLWCNPLLILFLVGKMWNRQGLLKWFSRIQAGLCTASLGICALGIQGCCSAFYPILLMYLWIFLQNSSLFPENYSWFQPRL